MAFNDGRNLGLFLVQGHGMGTIPRNVGIFPSHEERHAGGRTADGNDRCGTDWTIDGDTKRGHERLTENRQTPFLTADFPAACYDTGFC